MLTIWGRANSSNVMKVLWLCEELGLPYERLDAGGAFGRTEAAEYRAMNPNGLVPTIVEPDGFTLWESNSILRYLCAAHAPGTPLHPLPPKARAEVERWMDWQLGSVAAPMSVLLFNHYRLKPEERDLAAVARARDAAERLWRMLDGQLGAGPFVGGETMTLADIVLGIFVHRWYAFPIERADLPRLRGWYDRLLTRPAYAAHVALPVS